MKILVIGDVCTDVFVYGKCERLCPEAPVPVLVPTKTTTNLGMAGNVHENLKALGVVASLYTPQIQSTKTRYVDERSNQLLVRVDQEYQPIRFSPPYLTPLKDYDALIISDYNKGFLTEEDIRYISQQKVTFLDTKKRLGDYALDCAFIKVNEQEYQANDQVTLDKLQDKLIVTLGNRGCRYRNNFYPGVSVEVQDVSGAGDTFLAAFVFHYLTYNDTEQALTFANQQAASVVKKRGVSTI